MPARILMIRHMTDDTDDSAAEILAARGFELEHWRSDRDGLPADLTPYAAVVVYGGPHSVEDADYMVRELDWVKRWAATGKPYVGFCLGGQLLAKAHGADVGPRPDNMHEVGFREILPTPQGQEIFDGPIHLSEFHYHGIGNLPDAAVVLARSRDYPIQAFRLGPGRYGFQFHPEVNAALLRRWLEIQVANGTEHQPGADTIDKQLADAEAYLGPQREWLAGFLDRWTATIAAPRTATATAA